MSTYNDERNARISAYVERRRSRRAGMRRLHRGGEVTVAVQEPAEPVDAYAAAQASSQASLDASGEASAAASGEVSGDVEPQQQPDYPDADAAEESSDEQDTAAKAPEEPTKSATAAAWREYLTGAGVSEADLAGLTKKQMIALHEQRQKTSG